MRKFVMGLTFCCMMNVNLFAQDGGLFLSLEKSGRQGDFITTDSVSESEIENKNLPAAVDLIASVPGIFVTKAASQIKSDVNIRGIGDSFRRIGLFIDGRPEKMAVYGCGVSQTLLSGNIERIEITKGPDSVLYGSDGFGGLVNIITAEPVNPLEGEFSASYGTYNTRGHFTRIGGVSDKISYQVSVNDASSDGHIKNSGYDTRDYYAKFGYKIDDYSEITAGGKYFDGEEFEPKSKNPAGALQPESSYIFKRGGADIGYKREFTNGEMSVLAFGDFGEHKFSDGFSSKDSMYGVFAHFVTEIFYNNILKYGAEYKLSDGKVMRGASPAIPTGEWKKSEFALFALDEYKIDDKTKLFAGLRYNYDEIAGSFFAPRAGLSYNLTEKLNARAVYSRGFRSPYINELYALPSSNENLDPEEINSYEVGIKSEYFGITFDASGFVMNGDNIIQPTAKVPGPGMQFQNSGSYVFKGTEISVSGEIVEGLKGFAGYSYLDPGDTSAGIAENKIDLSVDYKTGKFSFHVGGMFVFDYYAANMDVNGGTKLDDFNVFNAKIHYNVNKELTLFAAADNFTNQKYEMFIVSFGNARIYEMPGSTFTLGAKYKF